MTAPGGSSPILDQRKVATSRLPGDLDARPVHFAPGHDRDALRFAMGERLGVRRANVVAVFVGVLVLFAFVVTAIVRGP